MPDTLRRTRSASIVWLAPETMPQLQARGATDSIAECLNLDSVAVEGRVGRLYLGQHVDSLLAACPSPRIGYDWGDEGIPQPTIQLRWRQTKLLVRLADTNETVVESIELDGDDIRTASGIRVGMLVDSLVTALGSAEFSEGECVLYMGFRRTPGVGYRLDLADDYDRGCGNLEPPAGEFPRGARIERINLFHARSSQIP